MYAINILPTLGALIKRQEEMVWDCLSETIQPIAIFIFPHTSQQELTNVSHLLLTLFMHKALNVPQISKVSNAKQS